MKTAYFIQTNLLCVAFLLVIFLRFHNKKETFSAQRIAFNRVLVFSMGLCVSDVFASLLDGKVFAGAHFFLEVSNLVYYMCLTLATYGWMVYSDIRINGLNFTHTKRRYIGAIPLIVMTIALLTNHFNHFVFTIDENNVYSRQSGVYMHWIITWGYFFVSGFRVVQAIRHASNRLEKERLMPLLWFLVAPLCSAISQMFLVGITPVQCGITFSMVQVATNHMQNMIFQDTLTSLNNRSALETYLSERLSRGDTNMCVLMCDVDGFKSINDNLGHIVGDRALKCMADALKRAIGKSGLPVFLCRYGGDEFLICSTETNAFGMEHLSQEIRGELDAFNGKTEEKFRLAISMGIAEEHCNTYDDVERLIVKADNSMYIDKASKGRKNGER